MAELLAMKVVAMDLVQHTEQTSSSILTETPQLVERMDSAIGDASTSIGMMMAELVRRSLRGGVGEISSSIHVYAAEQVDTAVERAMPALNQSVEQLATETSQRITDQVARQLNDELRSVENRTSEQSQVLAARITEEANSVLEVVNRVAGESKEASETTARELKELNVRARNGYKKVSAEIQILHEAKASLERQLAEAIVKLQAANAELSDLKSLLRNEQEQHAQTRRTFESSLQTTRQQLNQALEQTRQELTETREQLQQTSSSADSQLTQLHGLCAQFQSRLEELERPRGIKALFSRLTGGGKKPSSNEQG